MLQFSAPTLFAWRHRIKALTLLSNYNMFHPTLNSRPSGNTSGFFGFGCRIHQQPYHLSDICVVDPVLAVTITTEPPFANSSAAKCTLSENANFATKLLEQQQALAAELKGLNLTLMPDAEDKTELDWIRRIFISLKTDSTLNDSGDSSAWHDPNLICWAVLVAGLACLLRIALSEYRSYCIRVHDAAVGGRKPTRGSPFTLKEYVQYR